MAALTITAANVGMVSGNVAQVTAGESVTQGQPLRKHTDGLYYMCNNATQAEADASAIALTPAGANEPCVIARAGAKIDIGSTVAVGTVYVIGPSDGNINPSADLLSADWVTIVGHAMNTTDLLLTFQALEVQVA